MQKALLPLLLIVCLASLRPSSAASAKKGSLFGNSDSISEEELKIDEYFLASDQLEGRNLPSRGYDTAALFVASQLAEWGLKPGGSTTGTNGPLQPYFMPFELVAKRVIPAESKATLSDRSTDLDYGRDWVVNGGGRNAIPVDAFDVAGNLAFAGNGYIIEKQKLDPFSGIDVKGRIVVVAGAPPEIREQQAQIEAGIRGAQNSLGENCTDYLTPEEAAAKHGAIAIVKLEDYRQLSGAGLHGQFAAQTVGPITNPNGLTYRVAKFPSALKCAAVPSITIGPTFTTALFKGEKQSGEQIFYGTNAKQESFLLNADKKLTLHVAVASESGHAENVVAMVEGSDPILKQEYVVMSAHLDHIGLSSDPKDSDHINNGADDDGSGSSALLAIAHAYAEGCARGMRPKRSIIFLWNAGEEKGLWGSQYFAEFPPVEMKNVVADLNIDMIGRTKNDSLHDTDKTHLLVSPGEILVVGPNVSSNDLDKTIEVTNASYQNLALNHFYDVTVPDATHDNLGPKPRGQRIFYRSDHYNFAKVGVPIAFFTTGLHPDYHRPSDSPEKLDYHELMIVTKTISAVGWVLANQKTRPQLNQSLPIQLVKDMKIARDQNWGKLTPVLPPLPDEPF